MAPITRITPCPSPLKIYLEIDWGFKARMFVKNARPHLWYEILLRVKHFESRRLRYGLHFVDPPVLTCDILIYISM